MKTAALFPGQGSQHVGMAKELLAEFPLAAPIFEEASDAIKLDLRKLCLDGPEDKLRLTENGQPAILVTAYAWFQVLRRELDFVPSMAAGHSLGEYTALLAAGAMTLAEAVPLVKERGRHMQSAVPVGQGKMAAVLGLTADGVNRLCKLATTGDDSLVVPANFNAPTQIVVAGHATAVDRLIQIVASKKEADFAAAKTVELEVSAPFHSPLMRPVVDAFGPALDRVAWQPQRFGIVFNVDATFRETADPAALLKKQIDHPVRWVESMQLMISEGVDRFVEPGPGRVLSGLMKRIDRKAAVSSVESVDGVKELGKALEEAR